MITQTIPKVKFPDKDFQREFFREITVNPTGENLNTYVDNVNSFEEHKTFYDIYMSTKGMSLAINYETRERLTWIHVLDGYFNFHIRKIEEEVVA